jgi:hypothetical protein
MLKNRWNGSYFCPFIIFLLSSEIGNMLEVYLAIDVFID